MDKKKKDWVSVWVDAIGEMGEISSSGNYSCYVVSLNLGHFRSMVEKSDISARNKKKILDLLDEIEIILEGELK